MDCNLAGSNSQQGWLNVEWPTEEESAPPNMDIDLQEEEKEMEKESGKAKECSSAAKEE